MHLFQARQRKLKNINVGYSHLTKTVRDKTSAKCGPKTKHNVKHFSNLARSEMIKIFQCYFLVGALITVWTDFSKT